MRVEIQFSKLLVSSSPLLTVLFSGKPKKPSIFISSETPDRLEVTCSEEEEEGEEEENEVTDSSEQSLTLYIDGSAVATAREGGRVRGILFKYYLQYRDSFTAECFLSLNHINFTTSARQIFPANYSSPVAKPLTSQAVSWSSYHPVLLIISFSTVLSF